jgi:hypothetical protein
MNKNQYTKNKCLVAAKSLNTAINDLSRFLFRFGSFPVTTITSADFLTIRLSADVPSLHSGPFAKTIHKIIF